MTADWVRTMSVPPGAVPALRWFEHVTETFASPAQLPFALTNVSAIAVLVGTAIPFEQRLMLLMRAQRMITDFNSALGSQRDVTLGSQRDVTLGIARPPVSIVFDAGDFDGHQHEGRRSKTLPPSRPDPVTNTGNLLRRMALHHARSVRVLPTDFERTGASYTIPVIAPGWIAVLALSRLAETNHRVGQGIVKPDMLRLSVLRSVEQVLVCHDADRKDLIQTLEAIGELAGAPTKRGRASINALLGLALHTIEHDIGALAALDNRRRAATLQPRGLNAMLDALEDISDRLGMPFAPRLSFGR